MKDDILFAKYKDKPLDNRKTFLIKMKEYRKDVNLKELFTRITNYQIDTYGYTLDNFDPNWFERRKAAGRDSRRTKTKEYRGANRE